MVSQEAANCTDILKIMQILDIKEDAFDDPNFESIKYLNSMFPDEESLNKIPEMLENFQKEVRNIDAELNQCFKEVVLENDNQSKNYEILSTDLNAISKNIDQMLDNAVKTTEDVDKTMLEMHTYNVAKDNIEKSLNLLNAVLYMFDSLKKLENLIQSEDFNQIYTILSGYEAVKETISTLQQYEKVKKLIVDINYLKSNLKMMVSKEIVNILANKSYTTVKKRGVFMCISLLDDEFQQTSKSTILSHFKDQLTTMLDSLNKLSDWSDLSYAVDDLIQWIESSSVLFDTFHESKMPIEWNIKCEITEFFHSKLLQFYEMFIQNVPHFKFDIFKNITKKFLDLDKFFEIYKERNMSSSNFINLNLILLDKFESHVSDEFNQNLLKWQSLMQNTKKTDVVTIFPAARHLFQYFKDISAYNVYFERSAFSLMVFSLFSKLIDLFTINFYSKPLEKIFKSIRKGSNPSSSNISSQSQAQNENLKSLKKLFSKFSLLGTSGSSSNVVAAESDSFNEVLKEISCYLVSLDFCFDTLEHLESFLRCSTSADDMQKIDFINQKNIFIKLIDGCTKVIVNLSISECSTAFNIYSSRTWYLNENSSEVSSTSQYAQVLAANLKNISSSLRSALDLCRDHFITICKQIVTEFIDVLLRILLSNHKGLTMKSSEGQQLTNDMRLISSFLSNLPVLNSKLTTNQIPALYTQFTEQRLKCFMSILKFMLIEVDDNSKFGLASNYKKIVEIKIDSSLLIEILKWKGVSRDIEISEIMQLIKD